MFSSYDYTAGADNLLKVNCRRLLENGDNKYMSYSNCNQIIPLSNVLAPVSTKLDGTMVFTDTTRFRFDWISALYGVGISVSLNNQYLVFHNRESGITSGIFDKVFSDIDKNFGSKGGQYAYIAIIGLNTYRYNWTIKDDSENYKSMYFIQGGLLEQTKVTQWK